MVCVDSTEPWQHLKWLLGSSILPPRFNLDRFLKILDPGWTAGLWAGPITSGYILQRGSGEVPTCRIPHALLEVIINSPLAPRTPFYPSTCAFWCQGSKLEHVCSPLCQNISFRVKKAIMTYFVGEWPWRSNETVTRPCWQCFSDRRRHLSITLWLQRM
jgi:hypothetical protein